MSAREPLARPERMAAVVVASCVAVAFGALCVISNVCGCAGFVSKVAGSEGTPNVIISDTTELKGKVISILKNGYWKAVK